MGTGLLFLFYLLTFKDLFYFLLRVVLRQGGVGGMAVSI